MKMKCGCESNTRWLTLDNKEVDVCTVCNCYDPYAAVICLGNKGIMPNIQNENDNIKGKRARVIDWSDTNIDMRGFEEAVSSGNIIVSWVVRTD